MAAHVQVTPSCVPSLSHATRKALSTPRSNRPPRSVQRLLRGALQKLEQLLIECPKCRVQGLFQLAHRLGYRGCDRCNRSAALRMPPAWTTAIKVSGSRSWCRRLILSITIGPPLPMLWESRDDEIDRVDDHHSPYACWQQAMPRIDMILSTPDLSNAVPVLRDGPDFARQTPALALRPIFRSSPKGPRGDDHWNANALAVGGAARGLGQTGRVLNLGGRSVMAAFAGT